METKEFVVEQPNSCEIAINAKGLWSGKVKAYANTLLLAKHEAIIRAEELALLIEQKNKRGTE